MRPNEREAMRIGRNLREEFRARGEFTTPDYRKALHKKLKHLTEEAYESFVDHIAQKVDHQSHTLPEQKSDGQMELFDLEGEYKLGDTTRIAKKLARIDHADRAMLIDDKNTQAVMMANARKREELIRLRPYWTNGATKEQAVTAYLEENPDANPAA